MNCAVARVSGGCLGSCDDCERSKESALTFLLLRFFERYRRLEDDRLRPLDLLKAVESEEAEEYEALEGVLSVPEVVDSGANSNRVCRS